MSESDSDLEFESADEDTEQDVSEKEAVPETINHSITAVTCKDDFSLQNSSKDTEYTTQTFGNEAKGNVEKEFLASKLSEIKVDKEESELMKSDDHLQNKTNAPSVPIKDETEVIMTKQESQRVPLRLEKKLQQKAQLKENSIEKTDAINDTVEKELSYNEETIIDNKGKQSSWGFSSWGSSLLSTAASSVSTFSSQVSQGIGSVFETVESSLGAPSPEELASALKEKKEQSNESVVTQVENNTDEGGLGILPGAWTKVLETTSSKVLMGGLDTLELIGKKTMDILTEGDPRLMNKRNVFSEGISLSQVLREAKEKAEKESEEKGVENCDIINYSQIFDEQQGLVHLEALEMLSKQTQATFQRLLMRHSRKAEIKKRLDEIKSVCENIPPLDDPLETEEFNDFESVFKKHALELNLPINVDNLVKTREQLINTIMEQENISEEPFVSPDEIFSSSISSLAIFTARCIETFHKIAELVLVQKNVAPDIEQCATNLTGMTTVMCIEINNLSSRYHKCLDSSDKYFPNYRNSQDLNITAMVTNLYVEASNSNKYIQDAFQMLVPVLQVCLLDSLED